MIKLIKQLAIWAFIVFLIAGVFIIKERNLDINEKGDFKNFVQAYTEWSGSVIKNVGSLTGQAVKMDWLPES